jgi:hypothetical protein
MKVNCLYASVSDNMNCIKCSLNLYAGNPSYTVCLYGCKSRKEGREVEVNTAHKTPLDLPEIVPSKKKETIIPELIAEKPNLMMEKSPQEKFNTCEHRSTEEVSVVKKNCCSSWEEKGYKCNLLNLFSLNPGICALCTYYKEKG